MKRKEKGNLISSARDTRNQETEGRASWHILKIPGFRRQKQEDCKFQPTGATASTRPTATEQKPGSRK